MPPLTRSASARPSRLTWVLVALLACLAGPAIWGAATARAALTLDKSAPSRVLLGNESTVTLRATNDATGPYGYNLSFRDVLPAGVSYVAGSARFGSTAIDPTVIADAPSAGQTTLIFENVADISVNASQRLTYRVGHATSGTGAFQIGQSYVNEAAAFANANPRIVPAFSATGAPQASPTGMTSNTDQASTQVAAIEIEKSEPSSEGEIMRGVHDHQTVYTLRVTNNGIHPTTGITVDDYLPAGLEFLACGTVDNTTSAATNLGETDEYPGSGPIDAPGNAPSSLDAAKCRTAAVVETVSTDPDGAGPLPHGIYTHVRWTGLGTLQPGETIELQYVAAIPLRENTMDWATSDSTTGGTVPATTGAQTANLGNNSGPETTDEQQLTNYATADGVYRGDDPDPALRLPVSDETTLTRTAEDLAVVKSVDPGEISQNGISEWSLLFRTSEYRRVTGGVATDTLPNGLCPLGSSNYEQTPPAANAECDPASGQTPSLNYSSVVENAGGSWTLGWNLPDLAPSAEYEVTFPTRTRRFYQQSFADDTANPVRAGDSWTNTVDVTGDDHRICGDDDVDCAGSAARIDGDGPDSRTVIDASSASQTSGGISIDKKVLDPTATGVPTPVSCTAAQTANPNAYVDAPTVPTYGPGDRICWRLRVDFSSSVDTGEPVVRDFIPAGMTYEAGSAQTTSRNTLTGVTVDDSGAATDRVLSWSLADVDTANQVFEWTFATIVAPDAVPVSAEQTVTGNLMKLAYRNTGGQTFSLRDRVEAQIVKPVVGLVKDVTNVSPSGFSSIGGGNASNVSVGSTVSYRVRLRNSGDETARKTQVWDNLPAGITCADVPSLSISDGGSCAAVPLLTGRYRITWDAADAITVPAGGTKDLTYDVIVPQGLAPATALTNTAGVVEYERNTNLGGGDAETFVPASNIDPTREPEANAPKADDTARARLIDVQIGKTRFATSVSETGNDAVYQATIGETVTYRIAFRVPAGATLFGTPIVTDTVDSRLELLATPAPTVSRDGGTAVALTPTVDTGTNTLTVAFPGPYANVASTNATFIAEFQVRVRDVPANYRGQLRTNSASFAWQPTPTAPTTSRSATATNFQIVEPNLTTSKTSSLPPYTNANSTVSAGDVPQYAITVRNQSGINVAPSHETVAVDTVPVGIAPRNEDGDPAQDGDRIGITAGSGQYGVWDATARTITWSTIGTLEPGASVDLRYYADVVSPAPAGAVYTNSVTATGTSLAGTDANERTSTSARNTGYTATASKALTVNGGDLTKTAVSPRATIGDLIDYTVEYTLPANIAFYDLLVNDYLPNGVDYVAGSAQTTCLPACTFTGTAASPNELSSPRSVSSGQGQHGWFLDDIAAAPTTRTLRITYQGRINGDYYLPSTAAVQAGDVLTNSVSVQYNATNELTGPLTEFPNPNDYDQRTDPETASVTVKEPRLTLDKHVSGIPVGDDSDRRTTQPGDSYTYTVKVTNTGTSPAYDIDVTDTPGSKLTNVVANAAGVSPAAGATVVDGDGDDGTLAWNVPGPLAPGDTITLTYTADLADSSELSADETVVNTAKVPSYWGSTTTEHTDDPSGYREYTTNPPTDTVTLDVRLPKVTVSKTTGVSDGAGGYLDSANAEVGESFPWRVVITNPSPSSVAKDVKVVDVLPAGWTFKTGSASFVSTPTRPDVFSSVPTIVTASTGDTLTWADIGDIAPGGQVVLTFDAVPDLASRPNANPQVNDVTVTAKDSDDQTGSADGPYEDEDTANANLQLPVLTVAKTPDGADAIAGTTNDYTVVVRNTSATAPARDVVVTDVLEAHQGYVAGTATASPSTGFSEIAPVVDPGDAQDPDDDTTTIGWKIASIPAGGSVTITVPVRIPADLPTDTTLRNGVSVESREITTPVTDEGSFLSTVSTDVGVVKSVTAPTADAVPGQNITYGVVATNHGPSVATGVVVSDTLPSTLTLVSAPDCDVDANDERALTCDAGTLAVGETRAFVVTAKVAASATGTVSNTATVTSTTPDDNSGNDSSTAPKPLSPSADLVVTKDVSKATVLQGERFSYEIKVENEGPSDAVNVTLSDALPAGIALVTTGTGTDTGLCTPTTATDSVSCSLGTLTPGQTATITVVAEAVHVGTFNNVATAATPTAETSTTNNEDDVDVTVDPVSNVGIEKTAAATVPANGNLTYTLRLFNDGPSPATDVVVDDPLPTGVEFVSASSGCTYAPATRTVTCTRATLSVGSGDPADDPTYEITVKVPWALADATLENTVTISANEEDQTPADDESTARTDVGPAADLKTVKTAPTLPIAQSVPYDYEITVTNAGPSTAVDATLDDPMPAGVTALGAVTDTGSCAIVANEVACQFGDLAEDAVAKVTITARGDQAGAPTNVATASSETPEVDPGDNVDDAPVEILAASDVAIVKTAPATVEPDSPLTYTLRITNHGPSDATDVTVTDDLPPNVDFRSADSGCTVVASTVGCVIGDLEAGETVERRITVFVPYAFGGRSLTNIAAVTANEVDLVPENNSSQVTTVVGDAADLVVTKAAGGAIAGGQAVWTVVVRNDGPTAAQAVRLADRLPAGTTIGGAQPSAGTCSGHGRDLVCELGTIAAGGSVQVTVVADVAAYATGQVLRNAATATSPTPDPDPANNTGTADVVVSPAPPTSPDLQVTKVASTTKPELGKPLEYRIEVTNRGQLTASDVRLADTMSSNVVIGRIRPTQGRCDATKSTIGCGLGAIAPGQKVTVLVTVTPTTPGALSNTVSVAAEGQSDERILDNRAVADVTVEAKRAKATISKKASRKAVRGGRTVTYRITVKMGKRAGSNLRVCDRLPRGLSFVRATGAEFRKGRACWKIPYLGAGKRKTVRIVARTDRSDRTRRVTNTAVLTGRNVARRKASAAVRIAPALSRPGGVTG